MCLCDTSRPTRMFDKGKGKQKTSYPVGLKQIFGYFVYSLGYTSIRIPREYSDMH